MMMEILETIKIPLVLAGAYAIGCVCVGYYLVRLRLGQDLRTIGSGNLGARNTGRLLGTWAFIVVLLGDGGKGAFALWLAREFELPLWAIAATMPVAIIGHLWPVQLQFRGGKGIATAAGALIVFDIMLIGGLSLVALALSILLRSFTLGNAIAFAALPATAWWFGYSWPELIALLSITALVLYASRSNIAEGIAVLRKPDMPSS